MCDTAMRKSIEPYLQPGEEMLSLTIVQGKGMTRNMVLGGAVGAAVAGARRDAKSANGEGGDVQLSSKMGLAITPQRLLIFKAGGAVALKAKELITDLPIGEVDSIELGKAAMTKPVILTVRGNQYTVEAPKLTNTDDIVAAFKKAKATP
jgi:hypothetical protein